MEKEKTKKYEQNDWDIAGDMFLISTGSYFLSLVLAYVLRVVRAYIVFPTLGKVFPIVDTFFTGQSREESEFFNLIAYDICLIVSFFISMFILTPFANNMKTIYIKFEKGEVISPIRGIAHHFKYNGICMFMVVFELSIMSILLRDIFSGGPFAILFRNFSVLQSAMMIALITFIGELVCILPAQKRWIIDYYIGDE